jgi:transposase
MLVGVIWRRRMGRFIEGCDRRELLFLPPCVDDYVAEDSAVRIVDVFVDELDLATLGFADAAATGRPGYMSVPK